MKTRCFFFLLLILFTANQSWALNGISLGIGKSRDSINIYHLGLQRQFGSNLLEWSGGYFSGYHEVSFNYWEHNGESVRQVAYSPVFLSGFNILGGVLLPYLEGGIGVSFISDKIINDRDMSSHFQFEDRMGIGVKVGKEHRHDLNFGYLHYSNAGIVQPNEGIDIFIFSYSYSF